MIMRLRFISVSVFLLSFSMGSTAHAAPTPTVLAATSPWNVHYADDSCLLMRGFGSDKKKVFLRIERTAPSETFSMTLIGKPIGSGGGVTVPITIAFGPGGTPDKRERAPIGTATVGERLPLVIVERTSLYGKPAESTLEMVARGPQAEAAFTQLLIDRKGNSDFVLQLGPMDKPMAALRTCTDNLVKGWGLDPAVQSTLQRRASPVESPAEWLRSGDYPTTMLSAGKSAVVRFRLIVDELGGVTGCAIPSATKGEVFEKVTCEVLKKRARFTPALDAQGRAVASYYVNSVTWLMAG